MYEIGLNFPIIFQNKKKYFHLLSLNGFEFMNVLKFLEMGNLYLLKSVTQVHEPNFC